jgi:hypothetical protein
MEAIVQPMRKSAGRAATLLRYFVTSSTLSPLSELLVLRTPGRTGGDSSVLPPSRSRSDRAWQKRGLKMTSQNASALVENAQAKRLSALLASFGFTLTRIETVWPFPRVFAWIEKQFC